MFTVACTRFNNETWQENLDWRKQHNYEGCIYGTPVRMKENIPFERLVFVLEMNNDKNRIEGVGLIRKQLKLDKYYKIYKNWNYNRFTYASSYRIDRDEIDNDDETVFKTLDQLLFKGARHIKRGHGIQQLPRWILKNKYKYSFAKFFRDLFSSTYSQTQMNLK